MPHLTLHKMPELEEAVENAQRVLDLLKKALAEKEKAPTPEESRPCNHEGCDYEVGGRWSCEYPPI